MTIRPGTKFLLTGATGFVGRHLAKRLLADGHEVHAIVRAQSTLERLPAGVTPHSFDGQAARLCQIVGTVGPAAVIHLATRFQDRHEPADIGPLIDANVTFGAMLAEAMAQAEIRCLINTGSSWQYYQDRDYSPTCLYAATKQALEAVLRYYVEMRGMSVVTLILFDTYGPDDTRGKLLSRFARMAEDGSSLDMSPGEQLLDLVHVDDVVAAYLKAAERLLSDEPAGCERYAVSSGRPISLRALAALFSDCAGKPLHINWGARPYREREVMVPWSKGLPVPGWQPRIGLEQGLRRLLTGHV